MSMYAGNSPNSATTGLRSLGSVAASSNGALHSATGSGTPANLEATTERLLAGAAVANERAAEASLLRDCGLSVTHDKRMIFTDHGADFLPGRVKVTPHGPSQNWSLALTIVDLLNVPTAERLVNAWLTELAALTAPTRTALDDAEMKFAAYRRRLHEYPPDVVRDVLDDAGRKYKFFPSWAELQEDLDRAAGYRRRLRVAVESAA